MDRTAPRKLELSRGDTVERVDGRHGRRARRGVETAGESKALLRKRKAG